ncbi:hypothetical protein P0D72_39740 [Paraburkholderia sediminicola]|uniref:aspartate racemase/maleate isomerase family protein n=1 Tax=Paraburkholderia sediminicola TaxID=458836 RepID=UPI0038B702B2
MSTIPSQDDAYVRLDFTLDDGICRRAAIGLVVLATDHTNEHEWRKLLTQDGVACTTPITAALAALRALSVERAALLTPHVCSINDYMRGYIEARGVRITRMALFEHANDKEVARIDTASLRAAIERLGQNPDVEAVFVSCTSLRIAEIVSELEASISKPVISSNFAMAWHALRLAGVEDREPHRGRLFAQ